MNPSTEGQPVARKPYKPFVPPNVQMTEFTLRAVLIGLVLTVILGAANAYLGLRAGVTIAATYPASPRVGEALVLYAPRARPHPVDGPAVADEAHAVLARDVGRRQGGRGAHGEIQRRRARRAGRRLEKCPPSATFAKTRAERRRGQMAARREMTVRRAGFSSLRNPRTSRSCIASHPARIVALRLLEAPGPALEPV